MILHIIVVHDMGAVVTGNICTARTCPLKFLLLCHYLAFQLNSIRPHPNSIEVCTNSISACMH